MYVFLFSVICTLGMAVVIKLGARPNWFFYECLSHMFLAYLAHWQTCYSGALKVAE